MDADRVPLNRRPVPDRRRYLAPRLREHDSYVVAAAVALDCIADEMDADTTDHTTDQPGHTTDGGTG